MMLPTTIPRPARMLRRHWVIASLVTAGAVLRLMVMLAYQPALLYIDSFAYLDNVGPLSPTASDPVGYPLLVLAPLLKVSGSLAVVAAVQHLLGLGIAVLLYCVMLRWEVRPWLAALASAPVLLDAYQLQIEHNIMSDLLFEALLATILALLLWRCTATSWPLAVSVGLLLVVAVMVRSVGIALVVPAVLYVLLGHTGNRPWRRRLIATAALIGCFGAGVVGYAGYFRAESGHWGITSASDSVLYARAAQIADCSKITPPLRGLCPAEQLGGRLSIDDYAHSTALQQQADALTGGNGGSARNAFALRVLRDQPLEMTWSILRDFTKGFAPTKTTAPNDVPVDRWQFQLGYPTWSGLDSNAMLARFGESPPRVNVALATLLRDYQLRVGSTSGALLGCCALAALLAAAGVGRARLSGMRAACLLTAGLGLTALVTAAVYEFSWRYQLPGLVLFPVAGALAMTALTRPEHVLTGQEADSGPLPPLAAGRSEETKTRRSKRTNLTKNITP